APARGAAAGPRPPAVAGHPRQRSPGRPRRPHPRGPSRPRRPRPPGLSPGPRAKPQGGGHHRERDLISWPRMREQRGGPNRRPTPQAIDGIGTDLAAPGHRSVARPGLLAALAGTIESVAATAAPVVEATADAARGDDPARQHERLIVALRNLETAMSEASTVVRNALDDLDRARRRAARHK